MQIRRFFIAALLFLTGCAPLEKESVGIIGGADGPTAIFVATQVMKPAEIALGILLLAAAVTGGILLIRRHRRK